VAHPLEWRKGLLQKYRSIQALRALAACSVLVSHTYEPVRGAAYGAAGVDLFFVMSGFIMASVAAHSTRMSNTSPRSAQHSRTPYSTFAGSLTSELDRS